MDGISSLVAAKGRGSFGFGCRRLLFGLAGFSVPTQRSVVMLSIVMAAIILQRNSRPFNTLAIAMFAVLIFDPLAVLSAGFWLSFWP